MAAIVTKVLVTRGGIPLEGVYVIVHTLHPTWKITDANGIASYQMDTESHAIGCVVGVKDEEGDILKYLTVIEAGDTYTIDIPNINF